MWFSALFGKEPSSETEQRLRGVLERAPQARKGRILAVDDESLQTRVISMALSRSGHEIDVATTGEEAWELLRREPYDCIIMDVKMPGMSGTELFRQLQSSYKELARRVIFVTGDTLNAETRELLESSGGRWLGKPYKLDELERQVQACLAEAR